MGCPSSAVSELPVTNGDHMMNKTAFQISLCLALVAVSAIAIAGFSYFQSAGKPATVSNIRAELEGTSARLFPGPSIQRQELRSIASAIAEVDAKGDLAKLEPITTRLDGTILSMIDRSKNAEQRDCLLAAKALENAMQSLAAGGRWTDRDRFNAAFNDCK